MGIWEKAIVTDDEPGSRVEVDAGGSSWVRFLSESFRHNDGVDFGYLGVGCDVIFGGIEASGGSDDASQTVFHEIGQF